MQSSNKRLFLVATGDQLLANRIEEQIKKAYSEPTIYVATDSKEAYFKADNALPHVAIVDAKLKGDGFEVVRNWLQAEKQNKLSVILITEIPDKEHFVDQVIAGIVQFVTMGDVPTKLSACITKALNRVHGADDNQAYKLRVLGAKEFLFHQDDVATSVFLVKRGELAAIKKDDKGQAVLLGKILPGEFVGEMAHINNENRSASVQAITECELIEISRDHLDSILMTKPAWAKALITTLSKRLKSAMKH